MASEIKRRFTDTEMQIVRETDLLELLTHLGYQVKRIGRYHTTAEMDSLRIKDRRTWFRYSQNTGGDAITLVQQFCDKTFPEAVHFCCGVVPANAFDLIAQMGQQLQQIRFPDNFHFCVCKASFDFACHGDFLLSLETQKAGHGTRAVRMP